MQLTQFLEPLEAKMAAAVYFIYFFLVKLLQLLHFMQLHTLIKLLPGEQSTKRKQDRSLLSGVCRNILFIFLPLFSKEKED